MSPSISPPAPDVLANLMDEHAHRFPDKARLRVPDGAGFVDLPLLLGVPTGAAAMPEGARVSPAWSNAIASALKFRPDTDPTGAKLVADCLLWPPLPAWREWRERWAAIDQEASALVGQKIASRLSVIREPAEDDKRPESLPASDRGVWRVLVPQGKRIDVICEPPESDAWRMFVATIQKPGEDVAKRAREVVESCTRGLPQGALDRWPGLVVALLAQTANLAGLGAESALGEW
jgi:hypothetical protein